MIVNDAERPMPQVDREKWFRIAANTISVFIAIVIIGIGFNIWRFGSNLTAIGLGKAFRIDDLSTWTIDLLLIKLPVAWIISILISVIQWRYMPYAFHWFGRAAWGVNGYGIPRVLTVSLRRDENGNPIVTPFQLGLWWTAFIIDMGTSWTGITWLIATAPVLPIFGGIKLPTEGVLLFIFAFIGGCFVAFGPERAWRWAVNEIGIALFSWRRKAAVIA